MNKIYLNDSDFDELERLSMNLMPYKDNIVIGDYPILHDVQKPILVFGSLIGYSGKTIYEVKKNKIISRRSLEVLNRRFMALEARVNNDDIREEIIRFRNFYKRMLNQITEVEKDKPVSHDKMNDIFINSKWYIYERFSSFIGRKVIEFKNLSEDGSIEVEVKTAKVGMEPWIGKSYFDYTKNFLIILTSNKSQNNSLPTNYLIRVNGNATFIDLCLGHMTLINDVTINVVTKTIILKRILETNSAEPQHFKIEEQTKTLVSEPIYKFLYNRGLNRLTSPHSVIISNEKDFEQWHTENENIKRENRNNNIQGKYLIHYKRNVDNGFRIITDDLEITEKDNADIIARYSHKVGSGNTEVWEGSIIYSPITRALFLDLKGPIKRQQENDNISPIFLILNIPFGEREFNVLTGIVTGIRDDYGGSLGMMVVAEKMEIKNDKNDNNGINDNKGIIEQFFESFSANSSILPPSIPVANIDDLKRSMIKS